MDDLYDLYLTENLHRYFNNYYVLCDDDKTGKISINRAIELIKSANITDETISQVR